MPVYAATPWLHVEGNKIKDPAGNVVVLRGIALIDLGFLEEWEGGAIEMIDRLTDKNDSQGDSPGWYPKVVRIMIAPPTVPPTNWPHQFNPDNNDLYNLLRTVVDYCATKDMYVIIDWHYIANTYDHVETTSEFWSYMAPRFANDSHVLFELFNEPINDVNSDWIFNGNDTTDWLSVRQDMQAWVNIVRTYAPKNLILVAGSYYSQIIKPVVNNPIDGTNIVYVSHIYPGHFLNWCWLHGCGSSSGSYRNEITTCAAVYPVMMTEWGFYSEPNDTLLYGTITNYGQPLMNFREQYGIGNTAWCASDEWGPPMFVRQTDPPPPGTWPLRCGDGEMGCFTKDILYEKRNDDQPSEWLYGDLTGDNKVDVNDLYEFSSVWLVPDCNNVELDLDDNCVINFYEYSFFAQNWLEEL